MTNSTTILQSDRWFIKLSPLNGAAILNCSFRGRDILRPASLQWLCNIDMFQTGHFPLVPFSNRIPDGHFVFQDKNYVLSKTRDEEPHPIHGIGWTREWDVLNRDETSVSLFLAHDRCHKTWPWAFECQHDLNIEGDALCFHLRITNCDDVDMPAGLGFHPYFAHTDQLSFSTDVTNIQVNGTDGLPRQKVIEPIPKPLTHSTAVRSFLTDNCYLGRQKDIQICWLDWKHHLKLQADKSLPYTVIYSSPEQNHFCVEPVSHLNNALNLESSDSEAGLVILKPNSTFSASMTLKMET